MKTFIAALLLACGLHAAEVYRCDFTRNELKQWSSAPFAGPMSEDGTNFIRITVPETAVKGRHTVSIPFDIAACRGKHLTLRCRVRARNVSEPAAYYNGIKVMLGFRSANAMQWKNPFRLHGDFDWKIVSTSFRVPKDAAGGTLELGLQDSSGVADFAALVIEMQSEAELYPPPAPLPGDFKAEYTFAASPLRGAMSPAVYRKGDLDELASWGANLIRWQLTRNWGKTGTDRDLGEYNQWLNRKLDEFESVLADCERLNMKAILDLHTPPGGLDDSKEMAMFHEETYADAFVGLWQQIARRFKGRATIAGYDLINEPKQRRPAKTDYLALQYRAALAIREIDPEIPIIVEANQSASPDAFAYLHPLPLKNIVYQVHMYKPMAFTHQNINGRPGPAVAYPGVIGQIRYDRDRLRRDLEPVRKFQLKYGARIYAGEFAAARWAEGAARYMEDCIAVFEEYNWSWSYHAFRESKTWDVEYGSANPPAKEETDRKKVLLQGFKPGT